MSATLLGDPIGASAPFRTLELGATASHDAAALARLGVRGAAARGVDPASIRVYATPAGGGEEGGYAWRVWWAPPSRWRDEVTWPGGGTDVAVAREDAALVYVSALRTLYTSAPVAPEGRWELLPPPPGLVELPTVPGRLATFPLLRPPLPPSEWAFTTLGAEVGHGGRSARRVRATRRAGAAQGADTEPSGFWPGVDEYECVVDDALPILLRLTGMADGAPVATIAVDHLRIDATIPADVFDFTPPRGARIAPVARWP